MQAIVHLSGASRSQQEGGGVQFRLLFMGIFV